MKTLAIFLNTIALAAMLAPTAAQAEVWVNPEFSPSGLIYDSGWKSINSMKALGYAEPQIATYEHRQRQIAPIPIDDTPAPATETPASETKWSGRVNVGASLQTGNTEQETFAADVSIKAEIGDKHRASLKAEYNREKDDDVLTEDNRSLDLAYDYFYDPKWFINSIAGFEQDEIEQLELRTELGVGLGYQPYKSEELNLKMTLGPIYLRKKYENADADNSIAGRWTFDYDQKLFDDLFQGFHEHELLVPSDDSSAFLFESKTGIRIPIRKGIVGTGEIDFDWNNAPAPNVKEDDTKYTVKIGYEW